MKKLNTQKITDLRKKMNLSEAYMSKVLSCDIEEYKLIEQGMSNPSEKQLNMLSSIFAINSDQLFVSQDPEVSILARTHNKLTDNDNKQISEFLSFQKLLGLKKGKNKEVVYL